MPLLAPAVPAPHNHMRRGSADFASQFAVAFGSTIMGLGVFAGQPFHCPVTRFPGEPLVPANPDVPFCDNCPPGQVVAYDHCKHVNRSVINVTLLAEVARKMSAEGLIDDVRHLQRSKVYTHCGMDDGTLSGGGEMTATQANHDFFLEFTNKSNVLGKFDLPAGHCWPGDSGVFPCKKFLKNFWPAENCGYDGPGALLNHVYGPLNPPADEIHDDSLVYFDQQPFNGDNASEIGLSPKGWIYVPRSCNASVACRLHISMHGCSELFVFEEALVRGSKDLGVSFNRWAETNHMVVLWPHTGKHGGDNPTREQKIGCWDGYGQTGRDFDLKSGIQMQAIKKMIETVSGVQM